MCGKATSYGTFGKNGVFAQIGNIGEGIFGSAGVDTSGWKYKTSDLTNQAWGGKSLAEINADQIAAQERRAELVRETLRGPAAPEKSAMEIYDAAGVRDRRRRAALMGISQLRTPSGPGTASGGGYSGVGGGLY